MCCLHTSQGPQILPLPTFEKNEWYLDAQATTWELFRILFSLLLPHSIITSSHQFSLIYNVANLSSLFQYHSFPSGVPILLSSTENSSGLFCLLPSSVLYNANWDFFLKSKSDHALALHKAVCLSITFKIDPSC